MQRLSNEWEAAAKDRYTHYLPQCGTIPCMLASVSLAMPNVGAPFSFQQTPRHRDVPKWEARSGLRGRKRLRERMRRFGDAEPDATSGKCWISVARRQAKWQVSRLDTPEQAAMLHPGGRPERGETHPSTAGDPQTRCDSSGTGSGIVLALGWARCSPLGSELGFAAFTSSCSLISWTLRVSLTKQYIFAHTNAMSSKAPVGGRRSPDAIRSSTKRAAYLQRPRGRRIASCRLERGRCRLAPGGVVRWGRRGCRGCLN